MRIEYHPDLVQELKNIITYYNSHSSGLGNEFLTEFERQVLNIAAMPSRWLCVDNEIRRLTHIDVRNCDRVMTCTP